MTTQQQLGKLVRNHRRRLKLKFDTCAKIAGISKAALSKIENGKSNPALSTIEGLSRALKVTFEIRG